MVKIMKSLVEVKIAAKEKLSPDQRNLLSVAYKNVVGAKRSSWRVLNDDGQFGDIKPELLKNYKKGVEAELKNTCEEVLQSLVQLKDQNEKAATQKIDYEGGDEMIEWNKDFDVANDKKPWSEEQVFYLKMIGDYYRYLTEAFSTSAEYKENCQKYYQWAMNLAIENLEATHPTRLGL